MTELHTDFCIVGAGILGINIATLLKEQLPSIDVLVLERDIKPVHASVRNSGVLHAGLYYAPDSYKARTCRAGNQFLTEYCQRKGITIRRCGKVVLARTSGSDAATQLESLHLLHSRAAAADVPVQLLSARAALEKEPLLAVNDIGSSDAVALWSPSTSVASPVDVYNAQLHDAVQAGVRFMHGTPHARDPRLHIRHRDTHVALEWSSPTARVRIRARHMINAAGLWADAIAHAVGVGHEFTMLPFKGLYLYGDARRIPLQRLVYPVPDLGMPFLGVHFTLTPDGGVKIGPTAMPTLTREAYGDSTPVDTHVGVPLVSRVQEVAQIVRGHAALIAHHPAFLPHGVHELAKQFKSIMAADARSLVRCATPDAFTTWGRAGIRAQLVDTRTWSLVPDFLLLHDSDRLTTHVMNAVSPGWTCARPFAAQVVDAARAAAGI